MTEGEHGSTVIIIFTAERQGDEPDGEVDSNGGQWAIDEDNTCSEASDLKVADTVKPLISSRREVCRCKYVPYHASSCIRSLNGQWKTLTLAISDVGTG